MRYFLRPRNRGLPPVWSPAAVPTGGIFPGTGLVLYIREGILPLKYLPPQLIYLSLLL